ncbi:MarR family transcriptional regulator [Ralstonia pickettii]|jgi:DNA-binding MarR family transcriptional regulator|uniref:MarR family winged helix-turn-helix transcriptional regulator n=3 Tax=Pseudomonadota TaxID=1224 RepID=UPI0015F7955B|nr:MarR family transcriptional regulator [Ralstonia pickettii]MBC9968386.1 MarR family transcriptional regulator [Ralstonia insidiosa]MBA9889284.1 MarR family transcriptional regulator [Ralstonia pickettii]MBA9893815.1 MarR family transcriptional regulator [Ralstonia pickettii]MBA9925868.1 MarR family transcriptional regulator [Ralstonia pickettii]
MTKQEPAKVEMGTAKSTPRKQTDERIAHLVKEAYRGLSKALQIRLKEHDVMYGHWTFLRILWQTDGITQRQLSAQAGVMEPTTFAALQSMEKLGYVNVTRQKMPDSRKQVRVFLTPKGAALRAVLVPAAEEVNEIAVTNIPANDVTLVRKTLVAIIENLARAEELGSDKSAGHEETPTTKRVRKSAARS